jgi:anti-sigma-K factor RskA
VPQRTPPSGLEDRILARLVEPDNAPIRTVSPASHSRTLRLALAAVAAAILLLVVTNAYWIGRVNSLSEENLDLVALLEEQVETMQLANLDRLQWRRLQSDQNPGILAVVVWDNADGYLYTHDLPELSDDQVYQLWLVEPDNHHISAGTFRIDERGRGTLTFDAPEAIGDFARVGITAEPEGGSEEPTGNPVAIGEV